MIGRFSPAQTMRPEGPLDHAFLNRASHLIFSPESAATDELDDDLEPPVLDASSPQNFHRRGALQPMQGSFFSPPESCDISPLSRQRSLEKFFSRPKDELTVEAVEELLDALGLGLTEAPSGASPLAQDAVSSLPSSFLRSLFLKSPLEWCSEKGLHAIGSELYRKRGGDPQIAQRVFRKALEAEDSAAIVQWLDLGIDLTDESLAETCWMTVLKFDNPTLLYLLLEAGLPSKIPNQKFTLETHSSPIELESPVLLTALHRSWRCLEFLLKEGYSSEKVEGPGLWVGSILARQAPPAQLIRFFSAQNSNGEWLIPWRVSGGISFECAMLEKSALVFNSNFEEALVNSLLQRLWLLEQLALDRAEPLLGHYCSLCDNSPMGLVAGQADSAIELEEAYRLFKQGSRQGSRSQTALLIWCARYHEFVISTVESELEGWWFSEEALNTWWPSESHEVRHLVEGRASAIAYAIVHKLYDVVTWLERKGAPLHGANGIALLQSLEMEEFEMTLRWLDTVDVDSNWALQTLTSWGSFQLGVVSDSPWVRPHLLRRSLFLIGDRYEEKFERCLILLLERSGIACQGWFEETPVGLFLWRAFDRFRRTIAPLLLNYAGPWDCDRYGHSLWATILCDASDDEDFEKLVRWRSTQPRDQACSRTGLQEGASLIAVIISFHSEGTSVLSKIEGMAWRLLQVGNHAHWGQLSKLADHSGRSLLRLAYESSSRILHGLLSLGANPWEPDREGWILGEACARDHKANCLETCFKTHMPSPEQMERLLVEFPENLSCFILRRLESLGANLDGQDSEGFDLVARLLQKGSLETLRWTLQRNQRRGGYPSSQSRHPLAQMRSLSLSGVSLFLGAFPSSASEHCPIAQRSTIDMAMQIQPERALLFLEHIPIKKEESVLFIKTALLYGWSDCELIRLIQHLDNRLLLEEGCIKDALEKAGRSAIIRALAEKKDPDELRERRRVFLDDAIAMKGISREAPQWTVSLERTLLNIQPSIPPLKLCDVSRQLWLTTQLIHPFGTRENSRLKNFPPDKWLLEVSAALTELSQAEWIEGRLQHFLLSECFRLHYAPATSIGELKAIQTLLAQLTGGVGVLWISAIETTRVSIAVANGKSFEEFVDLSIRRCVSEACSAALEKSLSSDQEKMAFMHLLLKKGFVEHHPLLEFFISSETPASFAEMTRCMQEHLETGRVADQLFAGLLNAPALVLQDFLQMQGEQPIIECSTELNDLLVEIEDSRRIFQSLRKEGFLADELWNDLIWMLPLLWEHATLMKRRGLGDTPSTHLRILIQKLFYYHPILKESRFLNERDYSALSTFLIVLTNFSAILENQCGDWTGLIMQQVLSSICADETVAIGELLEDSLLLIQLRLQAVRTLGAATIEEGVLKMNCSSSRLLEWLQTSRKPLPK